MTAQELANRVYPSTDGRFTAKLNRLLVIDILNIEREYKDPKEAIELKNYIVSVPGLKECTIGVKKDGKWYVINSTIPEENQDFEVNGIMEIPLTKK